MTERSVTHATFTIERNYDASPARVFRAFSDPIAKRRWFAEGEGWHIDSYELDFKVGGLETSRFRFGDGPPMRYDAVIQDIVPNERIITAYSMMIGEKRISASLATTEFKPAASGTRLVFTEQGAFLDGFDQAEGRKTGSRQLLERLARELDRQA
jgi:uncharacterized protein YndB with AHSA1/START domain